MQRMREVIRGSLARSLQKLAREDRLEAALPVVCGSALATHCHVISLDDKGTLHLGVDAPEWLRPLLGMRDRVQHELQRVAGVSLSGLHFTHSNSTQLRSDPGVTEERRQTQGDVRPSTMIRETKQ